MEQRFFFQLIFSFVSQLTVSLSEICRHKSVVVYFSNLSTVGKTFIALFERYLPLTANGSYFFMSTIKQNMQRALASQQSRR